MRRKAIMFILIIIISISSTVSATHDRYEVHFLDTGQSDCILIRGWNKNYLIDTGGAYYTGRILQYLNLNAINNIDMIVLTHYHDDHYGGLLKIIEKKKVHTVILPKHYSEMKYEFYKSLTEKGVKVKYINEEWKLKFGKINLKAIGPIREDDKIENNNSIVLQGEIDGVKYLFAGDCEKQEEEDLISNGELKECDVLKVPHHSLNTSSSEEFIKALKPKIAVVTCNGVETPDLKIIKRIREKGSIVLRTDINGNVIVKNRFIKGSRDGVNIRIDKEKIQ